MRVRIFLKTHLFYPYKNESVSTQRAFQKKSCLHEDAATFKLRCSNFNKRKQKSKMPAALSPKILAYAPIRSDVEKSVISKSCVFHPSIQQHENSVFKQIHSGERFRKALFLVTENAVYVWTLTQSG